ncbi:MAG: hypothetical protein M0R41_06900 [Methylobacter tundripaludum]|nr:hypothetical protein [Methylobacter tundripaludum]
MSLTLGYKIPGSTRGGVFTVPDYCHGHIAQDDIDGIANRLRNVGPEPSWQAIRGAVLRLARSRTNKEVQHGG